MDGATKPILHRTAPHCTAPHRTYFGFVIGSPFAKDSNGGPFRALRHGATTNKQYAHIGQHIHIVGNTRVGVLHQSLRRKSLLSAPEQHQGGTLVLFVCLFVCCGSLKVVQRRTDQVSCGGYFAISSSKERELSPRRICSPFPAAAAGDPGLSGGLDLLPGVASVVA